MTNQQYVLGLDIGTTSAKAVLFDKNGSLIGEKEQGYPVYSHESDYAEQDPLEIEAACIQAIKDLLLDTGVSGDRIASAGFSSAMHSLICTDEKGEPLSPSLIWADRRAAPQAETLNKTHAHLYHACGTPIHSMSPFVKLCWMKENRYEPYRNASKFVSIKEFLFTRWFGEHVVDYAVASASGLLDMYTLDWNEEALSEAGIQPHQLSRPVPPTYLLKGLSESVSAQTGLPPTLPFAAGASDGPLANIGNGAISFGETALTIGTSGAIRQLSDRPKTDPHQQIFCYAVDRDLYVLGGPSNNGAIVLQWLKDTLGHTVTAEAADREKDAFERLIDSAASSPAGANGLLFLPYLNGERAPLWDPKASGSYIGLMMQHEPSDMIRAGMEGTLFNMLMIYETISDLVGQTSTLYANGGFARSPFWLQMLADIFGKDVTIPVSHQSAAWGAAWYSMIATGEKESLDQIKASVPTEKTIKPNLELTERYQTLFSSFKSAASALQPLMHELHHFRKHQDIQS